MKSTLSMYRKIHFIAIGGIGMSALARILLERGYVVSGSDSASSHITELLKQRGATVFLGQDPANLGDADLVVVSSAIRDNNPELQAARNRGITVWHRADLLGALLGEGQGIGVTGTSGKTSTSAMLTQILVHAGLDPTAILGGEMPQIDGNSRMGRGNFVVAEVDESDKSFLYLHHYHAIVTNIEMDHLDHYTSLDEIVASFRQYLAQLHPDGCIALGVDCPQNRALSASSVLRGRRVVTCATDYAAELRSLNIETAGTGISFDAVWLGENLGRVSLRVPGIYNVRNALCAMALAMQLGLSFAVIREALETYGGVERRFQLLCKRNGASIYTDYAHHPTKLKAALAAAKEMKPKRLIAVFQPHLYSRTRSLLDDFATSFVSADLVVLTDIYAAREDPEPGITGGLLFETLQRLDPERQVHYVADKNHLPRRLTEMIEPGDLVMMLGAGDINLIAMELCACALDS